MTRSGEKRPSQPASAGSGPAQAQKPGRGARPGTEAFGRFVRTLARLEGGPSGQGRKEQDRKDQEGGR